VHLAELAEVAGANVHLAVRDGLDVLLIDTLRPRSALVLSRMDVGSRMAIATSAAGRAYLAAAPAAERGELMDALRVQAGKSAHKVMKAIDAALAEYAQHGYCSSYGEWHPEIHALGFALHGPRGELYAVSVGGPAYKLPREMLQEQVAPRLLQTQRVIEREMGLG
jgi:DNA-binding IclR family transcriptional regulator